MIVDSDIVRVRPFAAPDSYNIKYIIFEVTIEREYDHTPSYDYRHRKNNKYYGQSFPNAIRV